MAKKKVYAVVVGEKPGIYQEWYGPGGAETQVSGFPGAVYKSFSTLAEAEEWYGYAKCEHGAGSPAALEQGVCETTLDGVDDTSAASYCADRVGSKTMIETQIVTIYTDGACLGNPGVGGYGVILFYGKHMKELSGGFRLTTNNRMEIMAAIVGLRQLNRRCTVQLYSDSRYLVDAIMLGWVAKWRRNGWKRTGREVVKNTYLWEEIYQLCLQHEVSISWVKGHDGNDKNERCDTLATQATQGCDLAQDDQYELENRMVSRA